MRWRGLALDYLAIPNLHPRKVAQSVVVIGPPRRCTMLSDVVAIGRSCFLTEAYAAEMEGMPTALRAHPTHKESTREHGEYKSVTGQPDKWQRGCEGQKCASADTFRIPNRCVRAPIHG